MPNLSLTAAWLLPLASFVADPLCRPTARQTRPPGGLRRHGGDRDRVRPFGHRPGRVAGASSDRGRSRRRAAGERPKLAEEHAAESIPPLAGNFYTMAQFGSLQINLGYYIDSLTVAMFFMVTLVATCIHVYSFGYMHEELHDVTDPLAMLLTGRPLVPAADSTASSNTCRSSASACWAW